MTDDPTPERYIYELKKCHMVGIQPGTYFHEISILVSTAAPNAEGDAPPGADLVDTGIVQHVVLFPYTCKSEIEEEYEASARRQIADMESCCEETYEFAGRCYGTLDRALEAYDAAAR